MNIVLSAFLFCLSIVFFYVFSALMQNTRLVDKPNERSLHVHPTVRGGGVVFIGLFIISFPFIYYCNNTPLKQEMYVFMLSTALLALISFLDDLFQLSARLRFLVQSIVALLVVLFIRPSQLDFLLFSITNHYLIGFLLFLTLIWAINHFNFMDGLDGFCAMQSVFLVATYIFLFHFSSDVLFQKVCLVLECSLLGFLFFNFPPAKLFMGDVGSASLGFIIFVIAIIGQKNYQIPIVYWFILNGLFLFDATITLARRILKKEKWLIAHKKHAYQRLRQFGISSRQILLGQLVLNTLFFLFVLLQHYSMLNFGVVLIMQLSIMFLVYFSIEKIFPMYDENS